MTGVLSPVCYGRGIGATVLIGKLYSTMTPGSHLSCTHILKFMRIYFDTEFTHLEGNADRELIAAGFISEDGREWYAEISDFNRALCSPFVVSTVLPLLEGNAETTITAQMFGHRLSTWLASFGEDVELISDHSADWELLAKYISAHLAALPCQIHSTVWQPSVDESLRIKILEAELRFWFANPRKRHHALFDARRLKLVAQQE